MRCNSLVVMHGDVQDFDPPRIRNAIRSMEGANLLDRDTVSTAPIDPVTVNTWRDNFVQHVRAAGKPCSVIRFLEDHDDAPFDREGFSSILRGDTRLAHVGRRLYDLAESAAEGPVRVRDIIRTAMEREPRPWTLEELVDHIRSSRDLMNTQLDGYLIKMPGVRRYDRHAVGLGPLDRGVMTALMKNESYMRLRFDQMYEGFPLPASRFWLEDLEDDFGPSDSELDEIMATTKTWSTIEATWQSGLFYTLKESNS
jgi:hypothetical protein